MKTLEELGVSKGEWAYDAKWGEIEPAVAVMVGAMHDEIADANGRLMAASKPMYSALLAAELAVRELCEGQDPANECWVTLQTIRAAIAQAGGV